MERFAEMVMRHQKELFELKQGCQHLEVSGWIPMQGMGAEVRLCEVCGSILTSRQALVEYKVADEQGRVVFVKGAQN